MTSFLLPALIASVVLPASDVTKLQSDLVCTDHTITSLVPGISHIPQMSFCSSPSSSGLSKGSVTSHSSQQLLVDAVDVNYNVSNYSFQLQSADYGLRSANGSWWPNISMSNSSVLFTDILASQNYSGSPTASSSPATAGKSFNPFNGSQIRDRFRGRSSSELVPWNESYSNYTQAYPVIQIEWNLINPSRYPQIAAAKKQVSLAKSQLSQAKKQVIVSILESYADYIYLGYQIGELQRMVQEQAGLYTLSTQAVNARLLARYQSATQFRNLISYRNQLRTLEQQQASAYTQLKNLLKPTDVLSPTTSDIQGNSADRADETAQQIVQSGRLQLLPWGVDKKTAFELALQNSDQLTQLLIQSGIAKDNANNQWGQILPTIGLLGYVTYQYTYGSQSYSPPAAPSGAASSNLTNYAGISISWNLFDGHATRNQALSYERQALSYRSQYENAANALKVQLSQSLQQLDSSRDLIILSLQDVETANQIASDLSVRNRVGLAEQYDVVDATISYHQARLDLIQSLAGYIKTFVRLYALTHSKDDLLQFFVSNYTDSK